MQCFLFTHCCQLFLFPSERGLIKASCKTSCRFNMSLLFFWHTICQHQTILCVVSGSILCAIRSDAFTLKKKACVNKDRKFAHRHETIFRIVALTLENPSLNEYFPRCLQTSQFHRSCTLISTKVLLLLANILWTNEKDTKLDLSLKIEQQPCVFLKGPQGTCV